MPTFHNSANSSQVISFIFSCWISSFTPFPMCFDLENHHSMHDNPSCHMFHHQKLSSRWISQSRKGSCRKLCSDWCESSEGNGRARGHDGLSERSSAGPRRRVWMADAPLGANASLSIFSLSFWMPTGTLNIENIVYFRKNLSENVKLNLTTGSRRLLSPFIQCFETE